MAIKLENLGYILNNANNVWMHPNYAGIAYNDGDEVEQRIAAVIKNASDISVLSTELRQHCTDWPSQYHLTGTRANIMRPFQAIYKDASVLEIGAGCGAITRYLGESGAHVLALEGSPRRAAIARSRTRDLDNVTVLAEKFDQFQCAEKFDVVTLIGVLEYANLFTPGDNPALSMLERVRQLLKPEGKLIIAIENQLGLKYFAGAPEDHLGEPMIGIEGRYRKDQPQTYGRQKLQSLLSEAKFINASFLAPFPDYKLPVSIVTEAGFEAKNFDASALAWQSVKRDSQLPLRTNFSLELAWPQLFENQLALDVSNSFLIIASKNETELISEQVLAFHFSTDRVDRYCKSTVFVVDEFQEISARYEKLSNKPTTPQPFAKQPILEFVCPNSDKYVFGKTLSLEFVQLVTLDGWTLDAVGHYFQRYFEILKIILAKESITTDTFDQNSSIPAKYFDAIPQNIIVQDNQVNTLIDNEWKYFNFLEAGYLLFRAVLTTSMIVSRFGRSASHDKLTNFKLIHAAFSAFGWKFQESDYQRYSDLESNVQQWVSGRSVGGFYKTWINQPLPSLSLKDWSLFVERQLHDTLEELTTAKINLANTEHRLMQSDVRLIDTETKLADKFYEVGLKDAQILDKNRQVIDLHAKITAIQQSSSWQVTRPIRFASRQFKRIPLFVRLLSPALKHGGGLIGMTSKLLSAYRYGGVSSVRQYFRDAATSIHVKQKMALIIHAFYLDIFEEIIQNIDVNVKNVIDIYITCEEENKIHIQNILTQYSLTAIIQIVSNRGRDILPFLKILPQVIKSGADLIIKVHTKKSTHLVDGDIWSKKLRDSLVSATNIRKALDMFKKNEHLGIIGPAGNVLPMNINWGKNQDKVLMLARQLEVEVEEVHDLTFVAGSMFFARAVTLLPLLGLQLNDEMFEAEQGQLDGTLAHAIERAFTISAYSQGYVVLSADQAVTMKFGYVNKS